MKSFKPNENFRYFLYWIKERMKVFWFKHHGVPQPWTKDPILRNHKFTNVYRSLDRESQYLIKHVIYNGKPYDPLDMFWRILLFRHFNLGATWDYLERKLGDITSTTRIKSIIAVLDERRKRGMPVYSNAFLITSPFMRQEKLVKRYGLWKGMSKHEMYLRIFKTHFFDESGVSGVLNSQSLESLFFNLRKTPGFANFLAMQYATDLNWSLLFDFDENSFIVESVGSKRGIDRVFNVEGNPNYRELIHWTHYNLEVLLREYGYWDEFKPLPNRMPTVMDIQNCFCETDKYLRGLGISTNGVHGKRIKAHYKPKLERIKQYEFPPKWGINL